MTPADFVDLAVRDGLAVAVCGAMWGRLELIEAIVDYMAPCALTSCTFTIGPRIGAQFLRLLDTGRVTHFRLMLDEMGAARLDQTAARLVARADVAVGAAVHAKFDVCRGEKGVLWLVGSQNTNKRIRGEAFAMGTQEQHARTLERGWEALGQQGNQIIVGGEVGIGARGRRGEAVDEDDFVGQILAGDELDLDELLGGGE